MKRFLLLLICISHIGFAQKYSGDSWATVNSKGSGTLGVVYYPQPGLIYEEGGKVKGVCTEILNDFVAFVQTKYGKKVTVKYLGAENVYSDFLKVCQTTPDILGVTNVTITEERKKVLKFTPGFLSNEETLITHKDAPAVESLQKIGTALKGYSAKMVVSSVHIKYIEQIKKNYMPTLEYTTGPSGSEILKEITTNPKLFTILDFTEYVDATRNKLPIKRQNVKVGELQELAFAMSKQTDWDKVWAEFLTPEYRKSEKYRKVIATNLGGAYLSMLK
ncbi:MAG: transporter substrate-binding domain-containing protein [Bacteroidetes bacterium]|nr:transporter substrate-binding domain-containing protein [Bacteroidota bacterium]